MVPGELRKQNSHGAPVFSIFESGVSVICLVGAQNFSRFALTLAGGTPM